MPSDIPFAISLGWYFQNNSSSFWEYCFSPGVSPPIESERRTEYCLPKSYSTVPIPLPTSILYSAFFAPSGLISTLDVAGVVGSPSGGVGSDMPIFSLTSTRLRKPPPALGTFVGEYPVPPSASMLRFIVASVDWACKFKPRLLINTYSPDAVSYTTAEPGCCFCSLSSSAFLFVGSLVLVLVS